MKIYCAGPITGLSADDVIAYFEKLKATFTQWGYEVLHPLIGKSYLRGEASCKAEGYIHPLSCNHAIFERDKWMVKTADVIYVNLLKATRISIGSCMEMAIGNNYGKHIVVAMEEDNIHRHSFVLEAASVVFTEHFHAMDYLFKLVRGMV